MPRYLVNIQPQPNGDHEVHRFSCAYLPATQNQQDLGRFETCAEAVRVAKRSYPTADGCSFCCPACSRAEA